jgi:hypothetical protein
VLLLLLLLLLLHCSCDVGQALFCQGHLDL